MTTTVKTANRIPVLCVHPSAVAGAAVFNPNSWDAGSKGVIQSCWTEYSVRQQCVEQIFVMCNDADKICATNVATVQEQWHLSKFEIDKLMFFAQHPDLHIRIQAFFSGAKSMLDLLVQLLTTERIVASTIDGFHRNKKVYGGKVLNALRENAVKNKKVIAASLSSLISEHKDLWIDQLIFARDLLVHPEKGMHQLMFSLEFTEQHGQLVCLKVHPPQIGSEPVYSYAAETFKHLTAFSSSFLALTRGAASPAS